MTHNQQMFWKLLAQFYILHTSTHACTAHTHVVETRSSMSHFVWAQWVTWAGNPDLTRFMD